MRQREFIDSDYPDIDRGLPEPGADDGIAVGRGMLGSMMAWIRGLGVRRTDVEPVVAAAPHAVAVPGGSAPYRPLKSTGADGVFDAGELMREILAYHERHKSRLYGAGLIVGLDTDLPPPAFPEVAAMAGFSGAVDSLSLMASDYEDLDAAHRAIEAPLFSGAELRAQAPRQVAWLINAACVRGAVEMAKYALGRPEITLSSTDSAARARGARMTFHPLPGQTHDAGEIDFSGIDNPLGLGRLSRTRLADACLYAFREAGRAVAEEFPKAVCEAARLGESASYEAGLTEMVLRAGPLGRLSRSYVAFSNLPGVVLADKAFQATLSRQAMVDALRHGSYGFQLAPYLAHTDAGVQAEISEHRHLGALALTRYSPTTLEILAAGHCTRTAVSASSFSSMQAVSDQPSGPPPGAGTSALTFIRALDGELNQAARAALQSASPRYLAPLVLGLANIAPVTEREDLLDSPARQITAGRRLGRALTQVVGDAGNASRLPWLRALVCEPAKELMVEGTDDAAAVRGLVTLFGLTNAMRAKSLPQSKLQGVPSAPAYLAAPEAAAVKSVLRLMGIGRTSTTSLQRTSSALLRDLLADMPPVTTEFERDETQLGSAITWKPALAGFKEDGSYRHDDLEVAFCSVGGRRESWCRLTVDSSIAGEYPDEWGTLRLNVLTPHEPFGKVFDGKRPLSGGETALDLQSLGDRVFANPAVRPIPFAQQSSHGAQAMHALGIKVALTNHLEGLRRTRPLEMAALFVSVAEHFGRGGADEFSKVPQSGKSKTFRLARASVASRNPTGFGLVVGRANDPLARTAAGTSLLDIGLEHHSAEDAGRALQTLADHPVSKTNPAGFTEMVQRSLGKLIERHPSLLPQAMAHGVVADDVAMAAWESQHPDLKTPESRAAMNAAQMAARIAQGRRSNDVALAADVAPQETAPRRRRMGV